jgi:hypothetical protein
MERSWYVCRDGKLWERCFSRREARYIKKALETEFPNSKWTILAD